VSSLSRLDRIKNELDELLTEIYQLEIIYKFDTITAEKIAEKLFKNFKKRLQSIRRELTRL